MKIWYYLKPSGFGCDGINAVALASVINSSRGYYSIVRTKEVSLYLKGLSNVNIGHPSKMDGDLTYVINLPNYAPFYIRCLLIANQLNIKIESRVNPYLGFADTINEVDRQLSSRSNLVLFCYFLNERDKALVPTLEKMVDHFNSNSFTSVCCGSKNEALLKGALDFRDLVQVDEIIKNCKSIKAVVTATPLVKEICVLLGIPLIYIFSDVYVLFYKNEEIVKSIHGKSINDLFGLLMNVSNDAFVKESYLYDDRVPLKKKFEVPYNFDEDILPYYSHYSSYINFLFLPPYYEDMSNTRTCLEGKIKGCSYMPQTRAEYEYHLELIRERNLKFVVLWQDRNCRLSREMLDYYSSLGTCGFIIANDENAKIIKDYNPKLVVIASIVQRLCNGISQRSFNYYDYIVMYYPFTRSVDALKKLAKIKEKLIIMPNSLCHTDCPGVQHWFVKDINSFDAEKQCPAFNDISRSTFIFPEHLCVFDDYVGGYKLQGREWRTDYVVSICESYFNRTTFDTLIPHNMKEEFDKLHDGISLEKYYNQKTSEIISLI